MRVSYEGGLLMNYLQMNGASILRLKLKCDAEIIHDALRPRVPAGEEDALQHVANCETVAFSSFGLLDEFSND